MHFLALGPRELKFLKLLEQNQACLPKLITPGSQVNHLLTGLFPIFDGGPLKPLPN